jgi:hypothetical protein
MNEPVELVIALKLEKGDGVELRKLTALLSSRIKEELNVWPVESVSTGNVQANDKSDGWKELGEIAITLAPIIIPPLFDLLKKWIEQRPSTPVTLRIAFGEDRYIDYDPTHVSAAELEKIVRDYQSSSRKK